MKTKAQISFMVTAKLISAFVFTARIVQSLYFLYTKFQASSHLVWLYSLVCVGPGRKPRRPVFSQRGSYVAKWCQQDILIMEHTLCNDSMVIECHLFHILKLLIYYMKNPDFCICENKGADQLCGNRTADQRLCFRYIDSTYNSSSFY